MHIDVLRIPSLNLSTKRVNLTLNLQVEPRRNATSAKHKASLRHRRRNEQPPETHQIPARRAFSAENNDSYISKKESRNCMTQTDPWLHQIFSSDSIVN